MRRLILLLFVMASCGRVVAQEDEESPIHIESPDQATTFAFGTVKTHSLRWNAQNHLLIAQVVFEEVEPSSNTSNEDTHDFRLPGVTLDAASGMFYAISPKGESIPVAKFRHEFFLKVIEATPNAVVRIQHLHGIVNVTLEALRPDDPALHRTGATVARPNISY